jgi:hypothetical protein
VSKATTDRPANGYKAKYDAIVIELAQSAANTAILLAQSTARTAAL